MVKNIRSMEMSACFLVYGGLLILALAANFFYLGHPLGSWLSAKPIGFIGILTSGAFLVGYTVVILICTNLFRWAAELEQVFRQLLSPLSYMQILFLSALSGFIEEWFFRGVLLSHLGLILSSLIFAIAHFIPAPSLWLWGVMNLIFGIILGILYQTTGSLVLVALVHTIMNMIILYRVNHTAYRAPALPSSSL